ncbi:polyprenol phosphomannose-dependent alpha 1,6 mannosyltransferase MptB [Actinomadura miaoliensis]|uniref:polyprenol phosphomannose-dependent alpha 1,6 mannosyltransferase MptB n=1 Tax=Actinomadura miaoliensis TaxID=430685 RepID=UPI0031E8BA6D
MSILTGPPGVRGTTQAAGGRRGRVTALLGLGLLGVSVAVFAAGMTAGPSGLVARWGPGGPFLYWAADLSRSTVTLVSRGAAVCAGLGIVLVLWALRRGWSGVRPRVLLLAGALTAILFTLLPPAGSIDILNYAVYGRITDLGLDPYVMTPNELHHTGDPVGLLRPRAWAKQPTVYGPVATAAHALAAHLGGASMAWIVFWLKVTHLVAFLATAVMIDRLSGPEPAARVRAAVLWTANPLALFWMVASGHVDVLAVALLTGAVYLLARRAHTGAAVTAHGLAAGALAGAAVAAKVTFLFPVLGLALACLRRPRTLVTGALGAAATVAIGYLVAGRTAIASLTQRMAHDNDLFLPIPEILRERSTVYSATILLSTLVTAAVLWWRLHRDTPPAAGHDRPLDVRPLVAFALACVVMSPVQYPWYDAAFLPLLALLPRTRFDEAVVVRGAVLSVVLLPGIGTATSQYEAARVAVLLFSAALVLLCLFTARPRTPAPAPRHSPAEA